jgi:ABC-type nitrate/sulfonate/bicarbonate transport system ATPase subunit
MAEVKLDDVSKVFPGGTLAVDHLSLTVADGEFLVLVGPSGCGKSTVLRIVAGLEDATDGIVAIDGQVAMHAGSRIYAPAEELALSKTFGPAWARYVETVKLPWLCDTVPGAAGQEPIGMRSTWPGKMRFGSLIWVGLARTISGYDVLSP